MPRWLVASLRIEEVTVFFGQPNQGSEPPWAL